MNYRTSLFMLFILVLFDLLLISKRKHNKISFGQYMIWLIISLTIVVFVIFSDFTQKLVNYIGIKEISNFVYVVAFVFIAIKLINIDLVIHKNEKRNIKLVQEEGIKNAKIYKQD